MRENGSQEADKNHHALLIFLEVQMNFTLSDEGADDERMRTHTNAGTTWFVACALELVHMAFYAGFA